VRLSLLKNLAAGGGWTLHKHKWYYHLFTATENEVCKKSLNPTVQHPGTGISAKVNVVENQSRGTAPQNKSAKLVAAHCSVTKSS
jgi:hypothetical protein